MHGKNDAFRNLQGGNGGIKVFLGQYQGSPDCGSWSSVLWFSSHGVGILDSIRNWRGARMGTAPLGFRAPKLLADSEAEWSRPASPPATARACGLPLAILGARDGHRIMWCSQEVSS